MRSILSRIDVLIQPKIAAKVDIRFLRVSAFAFLHIIIILFLLEGKCLTGVLNSFVYGSTVVADRMGNYMRVLCFTGRFYCDCQVGHSGTRVFHRVPLRQVDAIGT